MASPEYVRRVTEQILKRLTDDELLEFLQAKKVARFLEDDDKIIYMLDVDISEIKIELGKRHPRHGR